MVFGVLLGTFGKRELVVVVLDVLLNLGTNMGQAVLMCDNVLSSIFVDRHVCHGGRDSSESEVRCFLRSPSMRTLPHQLICTNALVGRGSPTRQAASKTFQMEGVEWAAWDAGRICT